VALANESPSWDQLDRNIGGFAAALGDPTRRRIYLALRQSPEPLTSAQVAELFSIHRNVARHHLDKLEEEGYARASDQPRGGRAGGSGRPPKGSEATSKMVAIHPGRRYDLLVELLVRVLNRVQPSDLSLVAEQIGREYGRELAVSLGSPTEPGYEAAVAALARVMGGVGFEVSVDHPEVICSLDRGMVAGIMGVLHQECRPVLTPHTDSTTTASPKSRSASAPAASAGILSYFDKSARFNAVDTLGLPRNRRKMVPT